MAIGFAALSEEEQDEAFTQMADVRLNRLATSKSRRDRMIASLARAASVAEGELTVAAYKAARVELLTRGVEIAEINQIVRHYGSWRVAKEALELSGELSTKVIEARFQRRRLGKIWRYSETTLRETLARCVEHYGHVPQVAEFSWWRERELELARKTGDDALHLPSPTPYRRRYGSWEQALLHFGYTSDQVNERLERR